jgi:hypothetical protein
MLLPDPGATSRGGSAPLTVNASLRASLEVAMKLVECWRWRFRDPASGRVCRTMYAISEDEARKFPHAERIPGTLIMREVDEIAFADTLPGVGSVATDWPPAPRRTG